MNELKKIEDIAFWETKCSIMLAQYYMKETPHAKKKIRNQYERNINFLSSEPLDRVFVSDFLIKEGLLKKVMIENREIIQITPNGRYAVEFAVLESEPEKAYDKTLVLSALFISLAAFVVSVLNFVKNNL